MHPSHADFTTVGQALLLAETGQCSQSGRYGVELSPQNGRIEVEFEVDVNRRGQRYRVRLFQDGRRFERGVYTSGGLSGSFTVRAVRPAPTRR